MAAKGCLGGPRFFLSCCIFCNSIVNGTVDKDHFVELNKKVQII